MSCFKCRNGHELLPNHDGLFCPICHEPVAYIDGKSIRQLRAEEEEEKFSKRGFTEEEDISEEEKEELIKLRREEENDPRDFEKIPSKDDEEEDI